MNLKHMFLVITENKFVVYWQQFTHILLLNLNGDTNDALIQNYILWVVASFKSIDNQLKFISRFTKSLKLVF